MNTFKPQTAWQKIEATVLAWDIDTVGIWLLLNGILCAMLGSMGFIDEMNTPPALVTVSQWLFFPDLIVEICIGIAYSLLHIEKEIQADAARRRELEAKDRRIAELTTELDDARRTHWS